MGGLRTYSAIATKIRAMESRLLRAEDYDKLAAMDSIAQAILYLNKIPAYQSVFAGREAVSVHRSDIERLLIGTLYYDFLKLYRFSDRPQKEILKLYFRKHEIAEIKHVLRHILNRENTPWTPPGYWETMQKFTKIHLEELNAARTVHDLAFALRDTDYRGVLEKTGVLERESLFDCEMVLDLFYFTEFWKLRNKFLKKKEQELLTENFGTRVDMLNMTWIYRARKYYQVSDAAVYGLLIPVHYKLRDRDIRQMVTAPDLESLEQAIRNTYYGRRFQGLELGELEKFYRDFLRKIYTTQRRKEPYSIAVINGYLYAREAEIKKLTTVLEGISYGLSKEETLAYINGA